MLWDTQIGYCRGLPSFAGWPAMDLKFSHVDILVEDLDEACAYYANILNARISTTQVWDRGGLHVR